MSSGNKNLIFNGICLMFTFGRGYREDVPQFGPKPRPPTMKLGCQLGSLDRHDEARERGLAKSTSRFVNLECSVVTAEKNILGCKQVISMQYNMSIFPHSLSQEHLLSKYIPNKTSFTAKFYYENSCTLHNFCAVVLYLLIGISISLSFRNFVLCNIIHF